MALTPGFKKFIGLVSVCAVVGGTLFAYKNGMFPKSTPSAQPQTEVVEQTSSFPQPINSPISQAENLNTIVDTVTRKPAPANAPSGVAVVVQEQQAQPQGNAGLDAVLKAGNKK